MSLSPKYWGESLWKVMYSIAYVYPETANISDKEKIDTFYKSLADVIPCDDCRDHYREYINEHPIDKNNSGKRELLEWINNLENAVNAKLQRPERSIDSRLRDIEPVKIGKPIVASAVRRPGQVFGVRHPRNKTKFRPICTKCLQNK